MKKIFILLFLSFLASIMSMEAGVGHLLPIPKVVVERDTQPFCLNRNVVLYDPTDCELLRDFLTDHGCRITTKAKACVRVILTKDIAGSHDYPLYGYENEAYQLSVSTHEIVIHAVTKTGVIRAVETLQQLAEGCKGRPRVEAVEIIDYPSFKIRGFMHDTGRSFLSVDELKKEIRLLAQFKVNTFHWHLTENQAWRFEVKAFPQLTADSSMTRFPGLYYTQEQCRQLDEYAQKYGIAIIPEIDMPGHSEAFERAMGHSMQTPEGIAELKTILTEVAGVFRHAPYIHIGGDEKTITYPNFLGIMTSWVRSLGRKAVIWIPNKAQFAGADMAQLWSTAGKAAPGIPNIDCRYNYINHFDVFADIVGIYKSNIYYRQEGSPEVAGEICALWNDHKLESEQDILRQNNFYAAVLASASRAWQGGGKQYIEQGGTILPNEGEEFDDFKNWEARFLFHKAHCLKDEPIPYVRQTNIAWGLCDKLADDGSPLNPQSVTGGGIYLRHTWGDIVPADTDKPLGDTAYVWTYVYSPKEQDAGALIEFQNYSRSEQDKAPELGNWDRKGSRIWLNDVEILPPAWQHHGERVDNETPLTDENLTGRKPMPVHLKKGWNKVRMILPHRKADGIRLNKWMFTFVLTDKTGRDALSGIVYDPLKKYKP